MTERAIFTPAWPERSHCYHPSLPPRRLRMAEEYSELRATMLTWPCMGGGAVSLPYLEEEIRGPVPARYRFYGYVSDEEYVRACQQRGIKVFGVVFSVQGWEFPAVLSPSLDSIVELNEQHGWEDGPRQWVGLREFNQDAYPNLWPSFQRYFPEGITNSSGQLVTNLWEEGASRDIHGSALHATWVECPDRAHQCHFMDMNNPAWRDYLKAIVRLQVDAGVDGVQFDEVDSPLSALQYGGCFCTDCKKGFRDYLMALPSSARPAELDDTDLSTFDLAEWMLARGEERIVPASRSGVTEAYVAFQRAAVVANFRELAGYVREYAAAKGRTVLVSANIYNAYPVFDGMVEHADVLVPEHANTGWSQPAWTRYAAALARDKPLCAGVNPYHKSVVPELVANLHRGREISRLTPLIYEAAALGINLSIPYGSWMGSVAYDAFYVPKPEVVAAQAFLADHEHLFSRVTANEIGVLYSTESNYQRSTWAGWTRAPGEETHHLADQTLPPIIAASSIAEAGQPFDVVILSDGVVAADEPPLLAGYRRVVAAGCEYLTLKQAALLHDYLSDGGSLLTDPALGSNLDPSSRRWLLEHDGTTVTPSWPAATEPFSSPDRQFDYEDDSSGANFATNVHKLDDGTVALHIVNYRYDAVTDSPVPIRIAPRLRLSGSWTTANAYRPDQPGAQSLAVKTDDGGVIAIEPVEITSYMIIHFTEG